MSAWTLVALRDLCTHSRNTAAWGAMSDLRNNTRFKTKGVAFEVGCVFFFLVK